MTVADSLLSDVAVILSEFGQDVTFRREVKGSYDPATGKPSSSSNDDETATVAFTKYRDGLVDNESILRGDRKALMDPTGLSKVPEAGDQIIGEGDTVSVVDVQKIQSGGTDLVYICQVRE